MVEKSVHRHLTSVANGCILYLMKNANKISAVYFLVEGFGDARLVKVGRTIDTERRLAELQTGNGRKVRYLGWIPGGSKEERAIQAAMAEFHERGEWGLRRGSQGAKMADARSAISLLVNNGARLDD